MREDSRDFQRYLERQAERVNRWLDRLVPSEATEPEIVHRAIRYSLLAGGKRLRPVLCIAAGEMYGASEEDLLPVACALEMIHTYSLVHDDLPSMDDDDLRRGRPTNHKVFGEAIAILAGDALLTHAFGVMSDPSIGDVEASRRLRIVLEVAQAAGSVGGMVGGQVLDITSEGRTIGADELARLHAAKTGALLSVSVVAGAIVAGAPDSEVDTLRQFGARIGLAFQIADDLLDVTATEQELGKTPGKDSAALKATFPALYGIERSAAMAREVLAEALALLDRIERDALRLRQIACFIVERRK